MTVTVRLYAAAAEALGAQRNVAVATPTTAGAVRSALAEAEPAHAGLLAQCSLAVNHEVVTDEAPVEDGDEVALLPPFAGGAGDGGPSGGEGRQPVRWVDVREPPLPVTEVLQAIADPAGGAQVVFLGLVRDHSRGLEQVERLDYSAYDEMARIVLAAIAEETCAKWPSLLGIALVHSVGELPVGAHTVLVACTSPHREDAYAANRHALEELKARVPVWKREVGMGTARWVGLDERGRED